MEIGLPLLVKNTVTVLQFRRSTIQKSLFRDDNTT